jgi:hypothetical protein
LIPDGVPRDQNGQLLRYVLIYNSQTFINFEMLRLGLAQTAPNSSGLACYDTFTLVQEQARQSEVGLWAPSPTLFPSATLRPTRTQTATKLNTPTRALSLTPSRIVNTTTPGPSSTPGTYTATTGSLTPSPSGTPSATRTPLPSETQGQPPVQPTFTPTPTGIQIINIFYRGIAPIESDEYVEIKNFNSIAVNLYNWWISEENDFYYSYFDQVTLGPGQTCRIYTNQSTGANWCGNFESNTPIWDNTSDCGELNNPNDDVVSLFCYP